MSDKDIKNTTTKAVCGDADGWSTVEVDLPINDLKYLIGMGIDIAISNSNIPKNTSDDVVDMAVKSIALSDRQALDLISLASNKLLSDEMDRVEENE